MAVHVHVPDTGYRYCLSVQRFTHSRNSLLLRIWLCGCWSPIQIGQIACRLCCGVFSLAGHRPESGDGVIAEVALPRWRYVAGRGLHGRPSVRYRTCRLGAPDAVPRTARAGAPSKIQQRRRSPQPPRPSDVLVDSDPADTLGFVRD
jgi:hypothetical protein